MITTFLFCCAWLFLFYNQIQLPNIYYSDIPDHIEFSMNSEIDDAAGYSLLHQFIRVSANMLSFSKATKLSLYTSLMIITLLASLFFTIVIIREYFRKRYQEVNPYYVDLLTLSLMMVSMIIINPFSTPFYTGIGSPNIWHNPTYIFSRTFSLVVFIYVLKSFDNYSEKKGYYKELAVVMIFSILSMWAKPSFLMSFLPAVCILFLYKFVKKEISLKFLLLMGISLLPSIIPLIFIHSQVFGAEKPTNIVIFTFGEIWGHLSQNIALSIVLGMAFPLYVFTINIKKISTPFLFAFTNYLIATLIYFFLAENGPRMFHANFSWGYLFGMFFMFLIASEEFFFRIPTKNIIKKMGWVLFLAHFVSGVYYFVVIASGFNYH